MRARATELEQGFPFGVVRQLFERPLLEADGDERDRWLAGAAALAADVLTGAATSAPGAPPPGPAAGDPGYAWHHGLYWLASNLAADSPLALVVDDLQWCDAPSARALAFIARRLEGQPLALILATRPLDPALTPEGATLVGDPAAELLRLSPLTQAAIGALVAARLSDEPDERFVRACLEVTGGNPFLVGELLDELAARGIDPTAAAAADVGAMVPTRRRQRGAAPSGAAGAGSRRARPRAQRARRRRAGGRRRAAGRTRRRRPRGGDGGAGVRGRRGTRRHRPVHPPDPARGDLRRPLARRTRAAAPRGGDDPARARGARRPGRGAGHAHRAGRRPGGGGAAADAAGEALALGDAAGAAALLSRALDEPPADGDRAAVVLELGQAHARAGAPEAIAPLSEIVERGEDAAAIAAAAIELSGMLFFAGRAAEGAAILRRAQERLPAGEPAREQLEIALLGISYTSASARREAEATIAGLRDPGGPARGRAAGHHARRARDGRGDVLALGVHRDRPRRARARGGPPARAPPRRELGDLGSGRLAAADGLDAALRGADEILPHARERGAALTVVTISALRALIGVRRGDLAAAEADAQAAIELAPDLLGVEFVVLAVSAAVLAGLERDETPDSLRRLIDRAGVRYDTEFTPSSQLRYASGVLRAAAGNHEAAIEELRGCDDPAFGGENPAMLPWRSAAALSLAELGRHDEARTLAADEVRRAQSFGAPRAIGVALRAHALVGPRAERPKRLAEALAVLAPSPARLEHARVLVDLGATFRAAGQRSAAREPLLEGLALAARCGARTLERRARAELAAIGVRPRTTERAGADSLTPSERRVVELAATGGTNREIAQTLFVTEKTVETHLGRSFRKLDISSRRQLPDVLARAAG